MGQVIGGAPKGDCLTDAELRAASVPVEIASSVSPIRDAFGRFRVSQQVALLDTVHQYDTSPMYWGTVSAGSGTIAHVPNYSATELRCTTSSGDSIKYQTRKYFRYQPGRSHLIKMSLVFGAAKAGVRRRCGYFDDNDGIFLEQNGTEDLAIVLRSSTSGSPVETRITKENWSLDSLDGTSAVEHSLDISKSQLLTIDLQWLSVGRVRVGFDIHGDTHYVHEFTHANILSVPYMKTANLPIRYEMTNTGTAASSSTLLAICATIFSEGGRDILGCVRSANTGVTAESVTTAECVIAVRPKLTFNSIANRGLLTPHYCDILASADILWELRLYPSLTGASWTSAGTNSIAEYDISASSFSGGELIASGYKGNGSGTTTINTELDGICLSMLPDGSSTDILALVVTSLGGSANVWASMQWREEY